MATIAPREASHGADRIGRDDSGFAEVGVMTKRWVALGLTETMELQAVPFRATGPQAFVGWQWTFPSGLHLSYAVGAWRDMTGGNVIGRETNIRVGYAW